jgi:uncharacterized protein (TIGR02452 family)
MDNNKLKLAFSAQQAVQIQEQGWYTTRSGEKISIAAAQKNACDKTRLYLPTDLDRLLAEAKLSAEAKLRSEQCTHVTVESLSTLEAARRLRQRYSRVGILNFASAKNPGGGFLGGARAQEESIARASGLYLALKTQPEFYAFHREQRSCLYSDRVIFSPDVPVFTDDDHRPLDQFYTVSMLTCAAPNTGALETNEPQSLKLLPKVFLRRIRMVLAVAAAENMEALVLGAWGCGAFRGDPNLIAPLFAEAIYGTELKNRFANLTFAIINARSGPDKNIKAFEDCLLNLE